MVIGVRVFVNDRRVGIILLSSGRTYKVYRRLLLVGRVVMRWSGPLAQGASRKGWLIGSWLFWRVRVAELLAFGIVLQRGGGGGGRREGGRM